MANGRLDIVGELQDARRADSVPRLIADIGGTNARFALLIGGEIQREKVLTCADFPSLIDAVETYLWDVQAGSGARRPVEASLAIAGPITADFVRMTNHAWQFSARLRASSSNCGG